MDFKYIIIRASSALLLLSGPLFTACDDDDPDAFITVSKQEIEVEYNGLTANGETVNFDLGSNHAWQATYVEEWIHPTHTEGDRGRTRIFLAIDENDTGKDREGYVIFEGGGSRRTVAVTQKLKIDALMVSPGKLTVVRSGLLETGEKASVYISANSDWTIEPSGDSGWITPSKTSGKAGEEDVELTIAQNTTGAVRTGTFVVVAGSKRATVTVTQNLEGLKVSATSFRVNKFGFADEERTPLTFTVTAAEAWTSTADGWLTLSPASGDAGETEVTLTVGENGTGALRSGEVKIVTAQTGLEETVSVSQNAKDNLFEDDGQQVGHVYYNAGPFRLVWTTRWGSMAPNGRVSAYRRTMRLRRLGRNAVSPTSIRMRIVFSSLPIIFIWEVKIFRRASFFLQSELRPARVPMSSCRWKPVPISAVRELRTVLPSRSKSLPVPVP